MQTTETKNDINVVACVLKKKEKLLIASRPEMKTFPGFFEFPGGKVDKEECLIEALEREKTIEDIKNQSEQQKREREDLIEDEVII